MKRAFVQQSFDQANRGIILQVIDEFHIAFQNLRNSLIEQKPQLPSLAVLVELKQRGLEGARGSGRAITAENCLMRLGLFYCVD